LAVCLLVVGAMATVSTSDMLSEVEAVRQFEDFMTKHNKVYESDEDKEYRFGVFKSNLVRIAELNALNEAVHGVNKFTDMTFAEFSRTMMRYRPHAYKRPEAVVSVPSRENVDIVGNVTSFDWRTKGAVTAVKDQGQCGSCWAFSATEEVESAHFLQKGSLPILAPQQTVSCDTTDGGCDGGDTTTAYAYMQEKGVETEAAYPYTSGVSGVTGTCTYNSADVVTKVANFTYATPPCTSACNTQDEETLAANLLTYGPVSICVDATDAWQSYTSGVLKTCPHAYTDLDHCVQLVGFDTNALGVKFWLVRNSWAADWGVAGYIHLLYGSNVCGVADEATLVTVA